MLDTPCLMSAGMPSSFDWSRGSGAMQSIARNSIAVVVGLLLGSAVNMGLIIFGPSIIPPPAGVDVTDMESIEASMHLFEAKHFLFPFLAHALGTLVGSFVAALLALSHNKIVAFAIGGVFLLGGISNVILLPSPLWFNVVDLVGAYIPMAWLGYTLYSHGKKT
jgi:hypothetical protein